MANYEVKIVNCSKELSAKQRIQLKDTTDAVKLDEATKGGSVTIDVDMYAVLAVHNEKATDGTDYEQYVIVDKNGTKYVTGSASFWNSFTEIADEMCDSGEEWAIKVYKVPSKNYKGKEFITCSVI